MTCYRKTFWNAHGGLCILGQYVTKCCSMVLVGVKGRVFVPFWLGIIIKQQLGMFWLDYWVIRLSILINCYKVCMMHVCYSCHSAAASVLKARVRVVGPRLGVSKLMISNVREHEGSLTLIYLDNV